ncbi:hypothetical protein V9T40_005846 [Parthenolecanium corni]|uniref:Uncharacterized protein n=1 Tax=Parthenolecanium corni TaxID=536013 RepID=A0AAN9TXB3_9HEMI
MSQWIFLCRPSTSSDFHVSSNMVHHLEYLFQDFKTYLLEMDVKNGTCSYQFNRRVLQAEVENRLHANKIYHIKVKGVYNPPLIYHQNSNLLFNKENPLATASTTLLTMKHLEPLQNCAITPPPSPQRVVKRSPAETAPIITVIKTKWLAQLPAKDPNSLSFNILAPFEFCIPSKSFTRLEFGFAPVAPNLFYLKLDNPVPSKNIILKYSYATSSLCKPLNLTFMNIHPTKVICVPPDSIIASVTCHKVYPSKALLLHRDALPLSPPFTPTSSKANVEDKPPKKKLFE